MGKSDANERNESSLSNCRVQPALSIKEGRVDFRKKLKVQGRTGGFSKKTHSFRNPVRKTTFKSEISFSLFRFFIPLYHNLSLFLPGKLLLSFLTILRKEPQQRSVLFKLIEKFGEIISRLRR